MIQHFIIPLPFPWLLLLAGWLGGTWGSPLPGEAVMLHPLPLLFCQATDVAPWPRSRWAGVSVGTFGVKPYKSCPEWELGQSPHTATLVAQITTFSFVWWLPSSLISSYLLKIDLNNYQLIICAVGISTEVNAMLQNL